MEPTVTSYETINHNELHVHDWRVEGVAGMSLTGISSLDQSIAKDNAWLAEIADEFGTGTGAGLPGHPRLAARVAGPASAATAANFAAQVPEMLRGVFYDGWSPGRVPVKFGPREYVRRFARDAGIHDTDVPRAVGVVTQVVRRHVSVGVLDEALHVLPPASASSSSRPKPGTRRGTH